MKSSIAIIGIVILIIGFAVAGYGMAYPNTQTNTITVTSTQSIIRPANRVISANGFWAMGAPNLQQGLKITYTVAVSNYTASDGPLFVYVLNESSFVAWGGCAPCAMTNQQNQSISQTSSSSFSWTVPAAGSYYFVVDASYYNASAAASFSATHTTTSSSQSTQTTANTSLDYAGVIVAIVGAIVLGIGLVTGSPTKKKQPETPPPAKNEKVA